MSFFDEVDATGVVEEHIQRVLQLEDQQARAMLKRYQGIQTELRQRLLKSGFGTFKGTPEAGSGAFTAQQLGGTLAQVNGAIIALTESLKGGMKQASVDMAMQGVEDLTTELSTFEDLFTGVVTPIDLDAQLVAENTSNFLMNKYDSSLDAYGQGLIDQITDNLTRSSLMGLPYSQVIGSLKQPGQIGEFFKGEEWKLHRIARTELHNIYSLGKLNGMREVQDSTIPDLMKSLMHPMDHRTAKDSQYAARLNLIAPIDEPFAYAWKGKIRRFMTPPDRPNDRSILIPYRKEWGKARGGAFLPLGK